MEKVLTRNLLKCPDCHKNNTIWSFSFKPPVGRLTSYSLMLWWEFEPFHTQLNKRQKNLVRRNINIIKFFYELFNNSEQQVIQQLIDVNDCLHTNILSPAMPLVQNSVKYCGFFLWACENSQIYHICASKA